MVKNERGARSQEPESRSFLNAKHSLFLNSRILAPGSWLLFFFIFLPFQLFALADVSVSASIDPMTLNQGWPIKGTLEITHYADQKIDEASAATEGKPLKISLLRSVKISPESQITVSIYQFSLPPQNKGTYTLPPISIKVNGKTYQTLSIPYEVQGPVAPPIAAPGGSQETSLKLEAFIDGPQELYPGQMTTLVYRYVYQGNIALSKEVLPMLEAKGLQKVGRYDIKNYTEGNSSIFEISQKVQAITPGEYSWGPSTIEGVVYVQDALGNQQFTTTKLISEAPAVKLLVQPFPLEGKPASFNGAFGQFTFNVSLTSPAKISVGDPITLDVAISGKTSNWDSVALPELCCQPGFAGFFKLSDLPPIGKMQGESKHFSVEMNPLSSSIKSIPAIQFAYFEPTKGQYKTLYSTPIAISVSPVQDIAQADQNPSESRSESVNLPSQEITEEWFQIYKQLPPLNMEGILPLETGDLKNIPFGSWWTLWIIPLSIALLAFQLKLKDFLKAHAGRVKVKTSSELYEEMLKATRASPLFFELLGQCLLLRLFERGEIVSVDITPENLPTEGFAGEVRAFLIKIYSLRFTSAVPDDALYDQALEEGKKIYQKLQGGERGK